MAIDYEAPLESRRKRTIAKAKSRSTRPKSITLEEAIETLQSLGFAITVPTSVEDRERQEESLARLGFVEAESKKKPTKSKSSKAQPEYLIGHLYLAHVIAEATYGPGELRLPVEQSSLFRSLLQQDQAAVRSFTDTADRQPFSRCFLITPGRGQDAKNKFSKLEVSQDVFDSDNFINNVTVRAGAVDVAGMPSAQSSSF